MSLDKRNQADTLSFTFKPNQSTLVQKILLQIPDISHFFNLLENGDWKLASGERIKKYFGGVSVQNVFIVGVVVVRKEANLRFTIFCLGSQNLLWGYFRTSRWISYLAKHQSHILISLSYLEKALVSPPTLPTRVGKMGRSFDNNDLKCFLWFTIGHFHRKHCRILLIIPRLFLMKSCAYFRTSVLYSWWNPILFLKAEYGLNISKAHCSNNKTQY